MREKFIDVLWGTATVIAVIGTIVLAIWLLSFPFNFVKDGWNNMTKDWNESSEQSEAEAQKSAEEWKTSPRNPKVAGQKCLDAGGFPTYSAWDSRFLECKGLDNKSVNIEINQ